MLRTSVHSLGDTAVLRCQGRIVIGEDYTILRHAAYSQVHARTLILDLAQVDYIDAGGLGVLLGLQNWVRSRSITLKLMNVTSRVLQIFELTRLNHVFQFCSVKDMLHLLYGAAALALADQPSVQFQLQALCDQTVRAPTALEERNYLTA